MVYFAQEKCLKKRETIMALKKTAVGKEKSPFWRHPNVKLKGAKDKDEKKLTLDQTKKLSGKKYEISHELTDETEVWAQGDLTATGKAVKYGSIGLGVLAGAFILGNVLTNDRADDAIEYTTPPAIVVQDDDTADTSLPYGAVDVRQFNDGVDMTMENIQINRNQTRDGITGTVWSFTKEMDPNSQRTTFFRPDNGNGLHYWIDPNGGVNWDWAYDNVENWFGSAEATFEIEGLSHRGIPGGVTGNTDFATSPVKLGAVNTGFDVTSLNRADRRGVERGDINIVGGRLFGKDGLEIV